MVAAGSRCTPMTSSSCALAPVETPSRMNRATSEEALKGPFLETRRIFFEALTSALDRPTRRTSATASGRFPRWEHSDGEGEEQLDLGPAVRIRSHRALVWLCRGVFPLTAGSLRAATRLVLGLLTLKAQIAPGR